MSSTIEEGVVLSWPENAPPGFNDLGLGRVVPFDEQVWNAAEERLQPGAGSSYLRLASTGDFQVWWLDRCGGEQPGIRRFRLRLPPTVWERPWEGLVAGLPKARWDQVSLIREIGTNTVLRQPSELSDPLTVLCIQGAASGPGLDTLDLAAEAAAIKDSYEALDFASRQVVAPPHAIAVTASSIESELLAHRPNTLWFSGHARDNPAGLLLADGEWLSAEQLAVCLRNTGERGGQTPLYVVLWACQTGSAPQFALPTAAPKFVEALSNVGVAAVLASQAPLADTVARVASGQIFGALASGRPLDHAVARARGILMRQAGDNLQQSIDWMCPVIWSKSCLPPSLIWSDRREEGPQRQATARKLLPSSLVRLLANGVMAESPLAWSDVSRLWVTSAVGSAETSRIEWAHRVLASQKNSAATVLWFDLSPGSVDAATVESNLRDWADMVARTIEHDDDRSAIIRTVAAQIQSDRAKGWRSLCASDLFIIAILDPPDREPAWLWDGVRDGRARVIVLAHDFPPERAQEGWTVDSFAKPVDSFTYTRTLGGLAMLGCPADRDDIESASEPLAPWIEKGIVLETAAGCVMPAGIAQTFARQIPPAQLADCHRAAHEFLDGAVTRRKLAESTREDILLARWRHARAAGWQEKIQENARYLLELYQAQRRAGAFLGIFDQVITESPSFPDPVRIGIGWAHLALGDSRQAIRWLDLLKPEEMENAGDAASWYIVRAEAEKSSGLKGSKLRPRELLQKALAAIEEERTPGNRGMELRCRHDLARLTHFFEHTPAEAVKEYEEIAKEWKTIPYAGLDYAITVRNLAEALMDSGLPKEAELRVSEARRSIPSWTQHAVVSELEYFAGRVAIRLGLDIQEVTGRFRVCREKALQTNHLMMAAIADSRLFWLNAPGQDDAGSFDDGKWLEVSKALAIFECHAWAARVIVDGRLRAARRLSKRGELGRAREELAQVRTLADANPAFSEGRRESSDLRRIAVLYSGLALYQSGTDWWREFETRYPEWASEWQSGFPTSVWEKAG